MPGRVFVTGASGFVGSAVVEELLARQYLVNALVNRGSLGVNADRVQIIRGDQFNDKALDEGICGCDAVIHLVGIILEKRSRNVTFERIHVAGTKAIVDATKRNGVRRYIHMSALGTRPDAISEYHKTKYRAEQYVKESGLDWTILQPSMIHGPGGFMTMEAAWARGKSPPFVAMPYFGAGLLGRQGAGKLQPVYVGDVARAFVDALEKPRTIGHVYPVAGPDVFTWPEWHHAASSAIVGKPRRTIPVPVWAGKLYAAIGVAGLLGFNRDQVIMSQEDNTADVSNFHRDFGWKPQPFTQAVRAYVKQL